jgi:hypothetical protein
MLFREDESGLIGIGQPAHAWICGQLARAWGGATFGPFAPWEEICLAAEQHDIGMAAWEGAPTINPRTGRPHSFMDLPKGPHMAMFHNASRLLAPQSRYAALLASLHFTRLAGFYDPAVGTPDDTRAVEAYLSAEREWQAATLRGLRADPHYAPHAAPEAVDRNRRLIVAWDRLSLNLCTGLREPVTIPDVPTADGPTALTLAPAEGDSSRTLIAPWPFARDEVTVICEGRRLAPRYADEGEMRAALAAAEWVTLRLVVAPA